MLRRLGWEVDEAFDGRDALEALAQHEYDVLLLDIQMPEVDGLEVARRIVADEPARRSAPGSSLSPPTRSSATARRASRRAWTTSSPSR